MANPKELHNRRKQRVRTKISKRQGVNPRLSVFRSNNYIYAQVIDDVKGVTLAAASSLEKDLREKLSSKGNADAAAQVGKLVAERALKAGVKTVVFDRGGYRFHGRVKALADGAREAGLTF